MWKRAVDGSRSGESRSTLILIKHLKAAYKSSSQPCYFLRAGGDKKFDCFQILG